MNLTDSGVPDRFITPLVEADWLWSHLDAPDLRIVDATVLVKTFPLPLVISGKRRWKRCHIPDAAFADLKRLSDPNRPSYTFSLPDAHHFSTEMGKLGIGADSRVVVYDSRQSMCAARLWWMLRYFGFDSAAVLNGGLTAWETLDHDTQRYRPVEQLRERFGSILDAERVITYCGAGIAAASDALAIHLLGHINVAICDGGLVEWNADRKLPLELGE